MVTLSLIHFIYNESLDIFTTTQASADNTFSVIGNFNSPDDFNVDVWENEDPRYSRNAFVGRAQFSNITSDELSTADRTLLKENSFDELYEHVC